MVINFNPKYIPGDIVYNHKKEIIRITSSYLKGTKLFYYRDGNYGWIREDAIKPIPLTPEILEKNGFEHDTKYWSRTGINNQELYDYYKKKGLFSLVKDRNEYIIRLSPLLVITIRYIHELQHFLFGLNINCEMEV